MSTEKPSFKTIEKSRDFELRLYAPMILAETYVEGSLDRASNRGFQRLAGYIFGDNRMQSRDTGEKIAMTSPVVVEAGSQKIAMTAPVTVEASPQKIAMTAPVTVESSAGRWRVGFVMPSRYSMATLPTPNNPDVTLREIPEQKTAAIVFAGFAGEGKVKAKTEALLAWMASRGLEPVSTPQLARYDPPWTLPFFRRNEILIACR